MLQDIVKSMGREGSPRLCELGKIKIGGLGEERPTRAGGTFRLPRKDDHFTITTMYREANGDLRPDASLMEELKKEYADNDGKLRRIPIYVLSNDIEDLLQSAWCWYGGATCWARTDGKTTTWWADRKNNRKLAEPEEEPFDPEILEMTDQKGNKLFKLHSIFNCVIAAKESRWGGVYRFRTTSQISFDQLYSSLVHLSSLTGGILVGMPLMLVLRPMKVAPQGKATTVHVVHVELMGGELSEIQLRAMQRSKFMLDFKDQIQRDQQRMRGLLSGPGLNENGEAAVVAAEFHPEHQEPQAAPESYSIIDGEESPSTSSAGQTTTGMTTPGDESKAAVSPREPSPPESAPADVEPTFDADFSDPEKDILDDLPPVTPINIETAKPRISWQEYTTKINEIFKAKGFKENEARIAIDRCALAVGKKLKPKEWTADEMDGWLEVANKGEGHFALLG